MLGSNTGRVETLAGRVVAMLAALAVAACAATTADQSGDPESGSIGEVRAEREGDATVVTLEGAGQAVFTAFAQQDPERIIVDLASVQPESMVEPVWVGDGLVDEVELAPYSTGTGDPMTRVELRLAAAADYEVAPAGRDLVIRIEPLGESGEDDALAGEPDPWQVVPSALEASEEPSQVEMEEADPASELLAVEVQETDSGSVVVLRADGRIDAVETFTLENPDRLVVDLLGLKSRVQRDKIEVGDAYAERVRVGQHDDMVRVVIDAGAAEEPFQGRRVMPAAMGLVVALGSGEEVDWAAEQVADEVAEVAWQTHVEEPAAEEPTAEEADDWASVPAAAAEGPEEAAEMAAAPEAEEPVGSVADDGPVTIYNVEYDAQAQRDRVVVMGERPVDYLLYEPSPDTVVLSIQNARIEPEAAVRITPEAGGPVSLVTAFEQPETQNAEVRIVVKRAAGLKPEVSRRGSLVVVDFPRDGSIAAAPPVLAAAGAEPAEAAMPVPAAVVPAAAVAPSAAAVPAAAAPAAIGAEPSIEVLKDGGLMDGKEYVGRRISLDFKDIEMADVLRLIAEVSDLNVIAGEEVQGRVTIRLVDVPWDQALDVILLTKGLGFMRVGNVLRIAPADVLKQEEEMRLQERRALEQLEDLVVKLQPVNYANVGDVRGMVSRLLTSRGTVDVDKRTNTIIIKDIPSTIDEATALIKAIDTQTPQVLIESKIVEANLDFSREFGVTWGMGAQPLNDAFDPGSGSRTDLGSDAFRLNTTGDSIGNNALFSNPLTAFPTGLFNIAGFLLDEKINLELQLQAAEVNGDGKVISSPRVVTLDNTKATIEQGVSIPFQTFENGDAQLEFVDAVLKLDVTPHITADRSIIMAVKVSRNAPDDTVFTLTGSPAIAKNQVDTETLVKDGQTLVLGGIYVVEKSQRQSRVPYLHSIPMLGALFRSDEIRDKRKELLIFVTPRVVAAPEAAS